MRYPQYKDWANGLLKKKASNADWAGFDIYEASARAAAICHTVEDNDNLRMKSIAFDHLRQYVEYLAEKYPQRKY